MEWSVNFVQELKSSTLSKTRLKQFQVSMFTTIIRELRAYLEDMANIKNEDNMTRKKFVIGFTLRIEMICPGMIVENDWDERASKGYFDQFQMLRFTTISRELQAYLDEGVNTENEVCKVRKNDI